MKFSITFFKMILELIIESFRLIFNDFDTNIFVL